MFFNFNFGLISTHFLPPMGTPPWSPPSHRQGTRQRIRYNITRAGGLLDRSRLLRDSYVNYRKKLVARLQLRHSKSCWIADPDIAATRRHTMDQTVDTSAWIKVDLRKRKHFVSEGHTANMFITPTPVRRRIPMPEIVVLGDMDVDGPEFFHNPYIGGIHVSCVCFLFSDLTDPECCQGRHRSCQWYDKRPWTHLSSRGHPELIFRFFYISGKL
jgi:hypothetical protein